MEIISKTFNEKLFSGRSVIHKFDTIGEFASVFEKSKLGNNVSWGTKWTEYKERTQAIGLARDGYDNTVKLAQSILNKIDVQGLDLPKPVWNNAVAGALPDVQAYLAGEPESMLALDSELSDTAPIRIFVSTTSSASITNDDLNKRGGAILALTMLLAEVRPVELWYFNEFDGMNENDYSTYGDNHGSIMVRVETAPLNVSVASYMLGCQAFTRGMAMDYCGAHMKFSGGWGFGISDEQQREKIYRKVLGASENDLVLAGAFVGDETITNPVSWVNKMVKKVFADL